MPCQITPPISLLADLYLFIYLQQSLFCSQTFQSVASSFSLCMLWTRGKEAHNHKKSSAVLPFSKISHSVAHSVSPWLVPLTFRVPLVLPVVDHLHHVPRPPPRTVLQMWPIKKSSGSLRLGGEAGHSPRLRDLKPRCQK